VDGDALRILTAENWAGRIAIRDRRGVAHAKGYRASTAPRSFRLGCLWGSVLRAKAD
jgi:hypothetical protein